MQRNGNLTKLRMDLKKVAAFKTPDPGCLGVFDDDISSVLQLVSRDGCHELNHRDVALSLFPDLLLVLLDVLHA